MSKCCNGCIGWRRVGLIIGWLLLVPSFFLAFYFLLYTVVYHYEFHIIYSVFAFGFLNAFFNLTWIYGTINHRPTPMLLALVYWGLLWSLGLFYVVAERAFNMNIEREFYLQIIYITLFPTGFIFYILCIFCYCSIQRSVSNITNHDIPHPIVTYKPHDEADRRASPEQCQFISDNK